jgi:predicted metal-dependent phosphoesterase TrpH
MRCDLHVHTVHSGMCTIPLLNRVCRESYNDPLEVYDLLKRRGMDLVTITDHDSIDAVESLRKYPDFFLSEEITCTTPAGHEIHAGVYDINEAQHLELQRRRDDLPAFVVYAREQNLFFSINHIFSALTGSRSEDDFAFFRTFFPAVETRNGQIPQICNNAASELAFELGKAVMGGSDSHTLACVGLTYTEVAGSRDKQEYMNGLRRGAACVHGPSGNYWKLTRAVAEIGCAMAREKRWTLLLGPLLLMVPAAILANCTRELIFAQYWRNRLSAGAQLCEETPGS